MAASKVDSLTRAELGAITLTPGTRGIVLDGQQVELIMIAKLTGDTSMASLTLSDVQRPRRIWAIPTRDSAGANVTALTPVEITFTHTDNVTIALSSLGDWTVAVLFVCGRAFSFA